MQHGGKRLWLVSSLRPDLLTLRHSTLRAVGMDGDGEVAIEWESDDLDRNGAAIVEPDLVGRTGIAVVVHDEWEGITRAKVRRLLPLAE
jgi:hypothetical protein